MFERLQQLFGSIASMRASDLQTLELLPILAVLLVSLCAAIAIAVMYAMFFGRRATGSDIHRAFPALGLAITTIFLCLQFSLPLSLGLLGALSIVRFRTPVKEPEDIGFLMLLIASSICCATVNFGVLLLLLALALATNLLLRAAPGLIGRRTPAATVVITAPSADFARALPALRERLRGSGPRPRLEAVSDAAGTTTATISLPRGSAEALLALKEELRAATGGDVSVFLQHGQDL